MELGGTATLSIWKCTRFGDRGFLLVGLRRLLWRVALDDGGDRDGMLAERRGRFVIKGACAGNDAGEGLVEGLEVRGGNRGAVRVRSSGEALTCDSFFRRTDFGSEFAFVSSAVSSRGRK